MKNKTLLLLCSALLSGSLSLSLLGCGGCASTQPRSGAASPSFQGIEILPEEKELSPAAKDTYAYLLYMQALADEDEELLLQAAQQMTGGTLPAKAWLEGALWLDSRRSEKVLPLLELGLQVWPDDLPLNLFSAEALAAQGLHTTKDALLEAAKLYNFGYMYLTTMEDYLVPTEEEVDSYYQAYQNRLSVTGRYADIRHILSVVNSGADEDSWNAAEEAAKKELASWASAYKSGEGSFGQLAHDISQDKASNLQGGLYWHVSQGELISPLDEWVFDAARQPGDTTVIRSNLGVHILYYVDGNTETYAAAKNALTLGKLQEFVDKCLDQYPMEVTYSDIILAEEPESGLGLSYSDILYPDIAHQRFPEVPLYLQQDYGVTRYGNYPLRTYGCGITSLAMLSSYMTDTELTPPILCERYGSYCSDWGTDYTIFRREPPNMGYYLRDQVFDPDVALAALEDGYPLISCQMKGYWTSKGHYIVVEKIDEKGVQVRDSNIYNYRRVPAHITDRHTWDAVKGASVSYWIFEKKQVRSELCQRCGNPENYSGTILTGDYLCERCSKALVRRNFYLSL